MILRLTRALAILTLLAGGCAGCQALGAIAGKTLGAQPIPAKYVPRKVPTLVLAEHRAGANVDDVAAQDLGRRVAAAWTAQKIAPVIDPSKLEELRSASQSAFDRMSIDAIGKKLGAEQVLYIDVLDEHIDSPPASDLIRGKMSARVRLIDVATGATLWPSDASAGYPEDAQSDWAARSEGVNDSSVEEDVRSSLSDLITRLFYKFTPANDAPD